jgi:hypothetical protein
VRDSDSCWRGLSPKDRERPRFMSRSDAPPGELRLNGVLRSLGPLGDTFAARYAGFITYSLTLALI